MRRLLVVEDEDVILKSLRRLLERNHYEVHCATSVDEAIVSEPHSFDLVLADLRLPGDMGTALIPAAAPVPVVIMTSHASVRSAVDAMRHGAIDYIAKPFDHDELLMVIERSLHQNLVQSQNRALKLNMERLYPIHQHVSGTGLDTLLNAVSNSADADRFLHLYGECGTDKESLAKAIHGNSEQRDGPFLVLDIAAEGVDATARLFGPKHPAAETSEMSSLETQNVPVGGYLQAAQNGTLVIRYPELLLPDVQQLLCKAVSGSVLQNQSGRGQHAINVNLLSISGHSIDLLLKDGHLTNDYANLFVAYQYEIAPLRQRPSDVAALAERHLLWLEKRYARKKLKISHEAMAALMANEWPGNVAELESTISRAVFTCRTHTIGLGDLGLGDPGLGVQNEASGGGARDLSLDEYFRYFVIRNQSTLSETELAARLGISRKALWERRQKMSLLRETHEGLTS